MGNVRKVTPNQRRVADSPKSQPKRTISGKVTSHLLAMNAKHGGFLTPESVVAEARKESSPLHHLFEWDDTTAAHEYRLIQASRIIRACVTVTHVGGEEVTVRAFSSLPTDRETGAGYRRTVEVLSNEEHRKELVASALAEFQALRKRHAKLQELSDIFAAVDAAAA